MFVMFVAMTIIYGVLLVSHVVDLIGEGSIEDPSFSNGTTYAFVFAVFCAIFALVFIILSHLQKRARNIFRVGAAISVINAFGLLGLLVWKLVLDYSRGAPNVDIGLPHAVGCILSALVSIAMFTGLAGMPFLELRSVKRRLDGSGSGVRENKDNKEV